MVVSNNAYDWFDVRIRTSADLDDGVSVELFRSHLPSGLEPTNESDLCHQGYDVLGILADCF